MKGISQFLSVLLHPIFVLPFILVYTYLSCGYLFIFNSQEGMVTFTVYTIVSALILPLAGILTMRGLGLISSLEMPTKQERIGPLLVTGMFYIWLFYNYYQNGDVPIPVKVITLGSAISLFLAFFLNNFSKLSLHGVGIGGLIVGVIIVGLKWSYGYVQLTPNWQMHNVLFISIILVLSGAVLSSRLYLKAHSLQQVYHGFLLGVVGQVLALNLLT